MKEKKINFSVAFGNLLKRDVNNVRENISRRCGLSHQSFTQKKNGERAVQVCNSRDKNEIAIIEEEFRNHNLNAWTGEPIKRFI